MKILVLNAGSSSQKSCLYSVEGDTLPNEPPQPLWEGQIDWTHQQGVAELKVKTAGGVFQRELQSKSRSADMLQMLQTLWTGVSPVVEQLSEIDVVGHRVVHGGREYLFSTPVTPEVKAAIVRFSDLAPAHEPANLEGIKAIEKILGPKVPQFAVFDTAFHSHMPDAASVYPGPYEWVQRGIRRYGFHGISHQYCAQRAAQILGRDLKDLRLINCHLGNGCSLAAIANGYSIDTTMGFTPLAGLMMGSRSGDVDPGILIHLMRQEGYAVEQLDRLLNQESGLKGISGVSADLRQIMTAIAQGNSRAQLAFDIYVHRLRSGIGAMLASLGSLDVLVFTAGVGENSAPVRAAACEAFGFLGLELDPVKNARSPDDGDITMEDSTVRVFVIRTQENWAIARECWHLFRASSTTAGTE